MIVNASGKPYSKRDGDAFVGDFKEKGYLAEALFNYLALLGWSPGDDREKLSIKELIELFTLERVKSAPAQFDINKLFNVNGLYITDMSLDQFVENAWQIAESQDWAKNADKGFFRKVAELLQTRTKVIIAVREWGYFFTDDIQYDMKAAKKLLGKDDVRAALAALKDIFTANSGEFSQAYVEASIRDAEKAAGMQEGKLNQPLRVAVTGCSVGAGIYETILLLGREKALKRLAVSLELKFTE
jgi:glutamyl/glutaminyl-tRNA synthetase